MTIRAGLLVFFSFGITLAWSAPPVNLPTNLVAVRQQVIDIAKENTLRIDNIPAVRAQLDPLLDLLEAWFIQNRPANEIALTQQPWKSLWYDDPTIDEFSNGSFGGFQLRLNRDKVYQVVEDGYYFNISESRLFVGRIPFVFRTYLKGAYTIANPAGPGNIGQPFLNVVNLEFVYNGIKFGPLPDGIDLRRQARAANLRLLGVQRVPGPIGITGKLWNLYIDEELRISAGFEDDKPNELDIYILVRSPRTGPTPRG
ncbi:MAG TPA: hypothetical protein PKC67_08005 [Kiritimatiellia bacterium]|nr:hypothetical protein [Kiritimatiellia bacterium]HMP34281.1 hypothetical protein [Kiritimatiellia bacterium]